MSPALFDHIHDYGYVVLQGGAVEDAHSLKRAQDLDRNGQNILILLSMIAFALTARVLPTPRFSDGRRRRMHVK